MTKIISLFNHKGGVSKTTTSFNLGWKIAEKGHKTLLVDLDSQCNLTGLILGLEATRENFIEEFYNNRNNLTMKQVIDAILDGMTSDNFISIEKGNFYETENPNLLLLPGSLDISDLDSQISLAFKIAQGVPAMRSTPSKLPEIITKLAQNNSIEYVIYDLSPNVGGLNEVALMSSDYFIVPTSPDYFCLQAVGSLTNHIQKWHSEIESFKEINNFKDNYAIKNTPCFLGTIQQRYRPRGGNPAKSFQKWIDRIREEITNTLVNSLLNIDKKLVVDKEKLETLLEGSYLNIYDLAHISDFNTLIAISQQLSKPIFSLTDEDIKGTGNLFGHALNTSSENRDAFNKVFDELADRVIDLIS